MEIVSPSMSWLALLLLALRNVAFVFAQPGAVEALLSFKHAVGDPPILWTWKGDPCLFPWRGVGCSGMQDVVSVKLPNSGLAGYISPAIENLTSLASLWLDGNRLSGPIPPGLGKLKNLTSLRLSENNFYGAVPETFASAPRLQELFLDGNRLSGELPFLEVPKRMVIRVSGNDDLCSSNGLSNLSSCAPSLAPALVFGPGETVPQDQRKHGSHVGAIVGGVAGAVVLVAVSIGFVFFCLLRVKRWPSAASESGSSEPSAQDWNKGAESPIQGVVPPAQQQVMQFSFQELDHATKGFSAANMIGRGRFGFVYKGLLEDGTIVAIKMRTAAPSHEFITEAANIAQLRHKHLVSLFGFCQEHNHQMLVYDYLPNASVSSHLYDASGNPVEKLDMKQRVTIALGAAKGLEYVHSGTTGLVHQDFKTSNVLLDENLVAKVTDFGLTRLLLRSQSAATSSNGAGTHGFMDPALNFQRQADQLSDVYSFGVFLLELVSGREPLNDVDLSIVDWARSCWEAGNVDDVINPWLLHWGGGGISAEDCARFVLLALRCTDSSMERRPSMRQVVEALEQVVDKQQQSLSSGGPAAEQTTVVTLGSELFR